MKTNTKAVAFVFAGVAVVSAAVFAANPQPQNKSQNSTVFTIKADGKPVAVLNLKVLDDPPPVKIISKGRASMHADKANPNGAATFTGGVLVQLLQKDGSVVMEIHADEVQTPVSN